MALITLVLRSPFSPGFPGGPGGPVGCFPLLRPSRTKITKFNKN